jgi:hypothetical protein
VLSADYLMVPVKESGKIRSVLTLPGGRAVDAALPFVSLASWSSVGAAQTAR